MKTGVWALLVGGFFKEVDHWTIWGGRWVFRTEGWGSLSLPTHRLYWLQKHDCTYSDEQQILKKNSSILYFFPLFSNLWACFVYCFSAYSWYLTKYPLKTRKQVLSALGWLMRLVYRLTHSDTRSSMPDKQNWMMLGLSISPHVIITNDRSYHLKTSSLPFTRSFELILQKTEVRLLRWALENSGVLTYPLSIHKWCQVAVS
jgi:hypothetical protein